MDNLCFAVLRWAVGDIESARQMIKISTAFLICQSIGFIGLSGASLVLTTVAFVAGQPSGHPATAAGLVLALIAIFAVLAAPYGPTIVRMLGLRRAYAAICGGFALVYVVGGLLMVILGPRGLIAYGVAPLAGIATGWFGPASQQTLVAYSRPTSRPQLMAKMAMSLGISCAIGLPLVGLIADHRGQGLALIVAGAMFVPQVVMCLTKSPITEVPRPQRAKRVWHRAIESMRTLPDLRRAAVLAGLMAVFIVPLQSMMAPLMLKLGMTGAASAGLCLGFLYLGSVMTPVAVKKVGDPRPNMMHAGGVTYAIAGTLLVVGGCAAVFLTPEDAFVVLCALMIGFGVMRMAGQAFLRGLAGTQGGPANAQHSLATFMLFVLACAPFGVLAWGLMLDHIGAGGCLMVAGCGGFLSATIMGRSAPTKPQCRTGWFLTVRDFTRWAGGDVLSSEAVLRSRSVVVMVIKRIQIGSLA